MPNPFFDVLEYPWSRPDATAFHRALYSAVKDPPRIDLYYRRCGEDLKPLQLTAPPDEIWKSALEQLCIARCLRKLCDIVLNDQSLAGLHAAVQTILSDTAILQVSTQNGHSVDLILLSRPYLEETGRQLNGTADKKELHKWLHHLQDEFYLRLPSISEQFPGSIPELTAQLKTFRRRLDSLSKIAVLPALASLDVANIQSEIVRIVTVIQSAVDTKSNLPLQESVFELDQLLGDEMPKIDQAMADAVYNLRLMDLAARLKQIAETCPSAGVTNDDVQNALALNLSTQNGITNHRAWQRIDSQVRELAQGLNRPMPELILKWRILKRLLDARIPPPVTGTPTAQWVCDLTDAFKTIDEQIAANSACGFGGVFIEVREIVREQFEQADEWLLDVFDELRQLATRITTLLR